MQLHKMIWSGQQHSASSPSCIATIEKVSDFQMTHVVDVLTLIELQVVNLKFLPAQLLPPLLGLGLSHDLEERVRPVLPLASDPVTE